MRKITYIFFALLVVFGTIFFSTQKAQAAYGGVSTFVGQIYDGDGEDKADAYFDFPEDVDIDTTGNLYIADTYNNVVRKINTSGIVSTVAGTGSYGDTTGSAATAEFALPRGVAVDSGGAVYVADTANNKVKKISGSTVSTLVTSGLSGPEGVEVYGTRVYIADTGNNAIKYVSTSGGAVTTLASTNLNGPKKLTLNANGSVMYVADAGSFRVLSVNTSTGAVSVVAGSGVQGYAEGVGSAAQFNNVWGVDVSGSVLYVSDGDGYTDFVRQIDLTTNTTSLFAEDGDMVSINFPAGLKFYDDDVYVANAGIGTIHRFNTITLSDEEIYAGYERFGNRNGAASVALFGRPYDLVMSPDGNYIYVADNNKFRRITKATGAVAHMLGSSVDNYREGDDNPMTGVGSARFSSPAAITINSAGTHLYVADKWNNRIRGIDLEASPRYSYLISGAGLINTTGEHNNGYQEGTKCVGELETGVSGCAYFRAPSGMVIDPTNAYLYVVDTGNNRVRKVRISDGQTWLIAGSGVAGYADGVGSAAKFNRPFGLTIDSAGENLYLADSYNHRIRKIALATNTVTTLVGSGAIGYREAIGTTAVLSYPEYIKMGSDGLLYFSEVGSHRVRLVDPSTALTKLVAGSGERGFKNGAQAVAEFNNPKGLAPDPANNTLYIADTWNDIVRRVDITGEAPFVGAAPTVTSVSPLEVNPAWDSGSGLNVLVQGTDFRYGGKAYFADYEAIRTYVQTDNSLAATLPLSQMSPGWYDVTVINLDGQKATKEHALGITDSAGNTPSTYFEYSEKSSETITDPSTSSPPIAAGTTFYAYAESLRGGYYIASGNVIGSSNSTDEIITGTGDGFGPQVRVFDSQGSVKAQFWAYADHLRSGVRVAACDVTGDGVDEIITAPGPGGRPHIRTFDAYGEALNLGFFALDGQFQGGAYVACGDVNGDGNQEIVVTAGRGGGAHVTVYTSEGTLLATFFAYDQHTFRGGIKVTTADVDGDGQDEIITGPEYGAPHIQLFQIRPNEIKQLSPGFYAFSSEYRGGVSVAGVDTDGDGTKELLVGVGDDATPLVRVYNVQEEFLTEFFVYSTNFLGGVNIAGGDVDGDGADELMVIPRGGGGPQVRVIDVDEIQFVSFINIC